MSLHGWGQDPAEGQLPVQLVNCLREAIEPSGLTVTRAPTREAESVGYGAVRLDIDGRRVAFRVGKTTPTKLGQFVTIWKRPDPAGEIAPFDTTDGLSSVVIATFNENRRGLFVFSATELVRRGTMSAAGIGGRRAIRVYAPWVQLTSKAAIRTQQWQVDSFVDLDSRASFDQSRFRALIES